jgi:hypothetical protein
MKFLKIIKKSTSLDKIKHEKLRTETRIHSLNEGIKDYGEQCSIHLHKVQNDRL